MAGKGLDGKEKAVEKVILYKDKKYENCRKLERL